MELIFDIPEKDVLEFGRQAIQKEFENTIKSMRLKSTLKQISAGIGLDEDAYAAEIDRIREEVWEEYKKDLGLDFSQQPNAPFEIVNKRI